jgi:hypothetical protein
LANVLLQQYLPREAIFKDHYPKTSSKIGGIHQHIGSTREGRFSFRFYCIDFSLNGFDGAAKLGGKLRVTLLTFGILFPNILIFWAFTTYKTLATCGTFISLDRVVKTIFSYNYTTTVKAIFLFTTFHLAQR